MRCEINRDFYEEKKVNIVHARICLCYNLNVSLINTIGRPGPVGRRVFIRVNLNYKRIVRLSDNCL